MNASTRLAYRASLITAGAALLLSSSALFVIPASAYADDSSVATSTSATSSTTPTTNPTLNFAFTIPVSDPTGDNPIPVTATFSQPVTGFQVSSLNIGAGHVDPASFTQTSPTTYNFNVVVTVPNGTVSIDSNDGNVKNAAGQIAIAAPQLHVRFDDTLPNYTEMSVASSTGSGSTSTSTNSGSTASSTNSTGSTATSTSSGSGTTTPPWIIFTGGPADGSTISTSTATFTFTTDGVSSVSCSFGAITTMYGCGSPQTFSNLVDGTYPFTIFAQYMNDTASSTRTFTVDLEDASSTSATSTDTTASSTDSTATSTDTTSTTNSTNESTGGGVSGGTISSGGFFGSNDGSSGGSISGGSVSDTSGSDSNNAIPSGAYVPGVAGSDEYQGAGDGEYLADATNDGTGSAFTGEVLGTSTEATTSLTGALDDGTADASDSQQAAAVTSNTSKNILWGGLLIVLILLIATGFWYSRRAA